MSNDTTVKIRADLSELKKEFQAAQRTIKVATSEFKAATAGLDDWTKSADGVSAKLKQLNTVLDSENKKLESLEGQYALTVKENGAASRAAEELMIKINNQKAAIAKTEKQISSYTAQLDEITSSSDSVASASDKLKQTISQQESELNDLKNKYKNLVLEQQDSSDEAKTLAREISALSSDLEANKTSLKNAEKAADNLDGALDDVSDAADGASDGFTVLKGAVATFAGNLASSFVSSVGGAAKSLLTLSDTTKEYRENMGKLETGFTTAGHTAEQAKNTYTDLYAVLGDEGQATEAASHLAKLCDTEKELEKWTTITTGVYGTFGDSLPIESLTEAANESAKTGQVTGALADALNWAGVSEDKFNESLAGCSSEQERQEKITEQLNVLYGDAAKKYEEVNGSVMDANRANAEYSDTMGELGAKVEPITTKLKEGFNKLLEKVLELVNGVDMSAFTGAIESAFSVLTDTVLPAITEGFGWILDHKDAIIAGLAGIAAGFLAFKVVTLIQSVTSAMKGMTLAQAALNLVMNMNPIGLIVAAITALVTAFVVLWNKCEWFREFWIGLWDGIKAVVSTVWDAIVGFFTAAWENIKLVWSVVTGWFKAIWDGIKQVFSTVANWFKNIFSSAWNAIKSVWSVVTGWFKAIWDGIKKVFSVVATWFKDIFKKAWDGIKNIWNSVTGFFSGIWSGIKNVFSNVVGWFKSVFQKAVDTIKNVFSKIGDFFGGLWDTIKNKIVSIGTGIADTIGGAIKGGVNGIIGFVESVLNKIPEVVNGAIKLINKIPGVDIGWRMDKFNLPRLAKGGITKGATLAEIGEDGREAVIPLEKNLGWLRELAKKFKSELGAEFMQGGNSTVVNNFYQTNNSPVALSKLEIYRQSKNLLSMKG